MSDCNFRLVKYNLEMKATLIKKFEEAKDTYSFFWQLSQKVQWLPGQYLYYTLPKLILPDDRGPTRQFTIANSPTEGDYVQLATRIRQDSGFKQTLNQLEIGSEVEVEGPSGSYILDENLSGPQILLAGGIGITPFRSFIKYVADKKLNIPIFLIYSNSDSNFVFKKELDEWQKTHNNIKIEYIDTSISGRLDTKMLSSLLTSNNLLLTSNLWSVGPPRFVSAMEDALEELGVNEDNVHTEKFTGY